MQFRHLLSCLMRVLHGAGMSLEVRKTFVLEGSVQIAQAEVDALVAIGVSMAEGSVEVLGSDIIECDTAILGRGDAGEVPAPTRKRFSRAMDNIVTLRKMLRAEVELAPCNAVWSILRSCLSFDMAVLPHHRC